MALKMRPAVTGLGPIGPYGRAESTGRMVTAGDTHSNWVSGTCSNLDGPFPMQKQPNMVHICIYIYIYICKYIIYTYIQTYVLIVLYDSFSSVG